MDELKDSFAAVGKVRQMIEAKELQVLMGICTGVVADGVINDQEIFFLRNWLLENRDIASSWIGSPIFRKLQDVTANESISDDDRNALLALLTSLSGTSFSETGCAQPEVISIPFDEEGVTFRNKVFCFTGRFVFGTRPDCKKAVLALGAECSETITRSLDYLVIGTNVEPSWVNTSYGRKIEAALALRKKGAALKIISEQRWTNHLKKSA